MNERVIIPIKTPSGYKAIGHAGIATNGFTGAAYAYIDDSVADVYISSGGSGSISVNVLFMRKFD